MIVVGWESNIVTNLTNTISSITDSAGNTYVEAGAARCVDTGVGNFNDIWYAKNSKSGATSIVITPAASVASAAVVIWEFSGVDTNAPLDQTAVLNSQAASATPSGAPVTFTSPNELVISIANEANSMTGIYPGNLFVNDANLFASGWAHLVASSTGTYFAQWTQSPAGTYASSTVSFKAAGTYSACDLNQDGAVDILDVQLATNLALAPTNCTAPYGQCNIGFVQVVLTDAMGGACSMPVLGFAPSTVSFGNVTVGNSSTVGVTLSGSGTTSTTITQAAVSGTGFSINGLTLPLTLAVGQNANFNVVFTPTGAGSVTGGIAFTSSALNTPFTLNLSGSGVTVVPHSVTLSWTASTSTNIASYNIYRITSTSSTAPPTPYPSLATVPATTACSGTACTYTDTAVQAGQSYWYYAAAVDTSNNVSGPSNAAQAIVPTP